jgi:Tfp pilus assembly protein PilP
MFPARRPEPPPEMKRKPEPPRAPPLPFQFFGRMVENGTTMVFLNRQDDVFAVKAGDTIGSTYRVEEINGSEIVLTYLPLKQRQTLPIGSIQ